MQTGTLYIVATPIGNLADISQRALAVLAEVDLIAAEDTRHSKRLLQHFAIDTPLQALHEYNEQQQVTKLLQRLQQGHSLALVSDAGTPLISDPGFRLVKAARAAGITVVPIPGACAAIAALSAAGLPADRFIFEGFLSAKSGARQHRLTELATETRTLIFYEAPHRVVALLADMLAVFGPERVVVLARELTKTFETIYQDDLQALQTWITADSNRQRGEFVVLVQGAVRDEAELAPESVTVLKALLAELPLKQAVKLAAQITGEKKNQLYELALRL